MRNSATGTTGEVCRRLGACVWATVLIWGWASAAAGAGAGAEWTWLHPLPQGNDLYAGWAPAVDDLYVGGHGGVVMHWDGVTWTTMPTPTMKTVFGISGTSATDIWAVGGDEYTLEQDDRALYMHWDGSEWTEYPVPDFFGTTYPAHGVFALASDDVYAWHDNQTVLAHWNGAQWSFEFLPVAVEGGFSDLIRVGADHLFLVGSHGQIVHRDHGTWSLEQKTESGTWSTDLLTTVWGREAGDGIEVLAGGNYGQVYSRASDGTWAAVDLNSGCFDFGCEAMIRLWGTAPDDLYLVGGNNIRHTDGNPPPVSRNDYIGQIRNGWVDGVGVGDVLYLFGYDGVVHEYESDGVGGGTLSPLTVGQQAMMLLGNLTIAGCGDGAFLVGGHTEYTTQHPLWIYDGAWFQPFTELPAGMPQATFVRAILAEGPDDIYLNWAGQSTTGAGTVHWDGESWSEIGPGYLAPRLVVEFWKSPTGLIYAPGPADVRAHDGATWNIVLQYGDLGYDLAITAFAGVTDSELYIGTDDGRIFRYDGGGWTQETTSISTPIRAIAATAADQWAVGDDGTALHRAGTTWTQMSAVEVRDGDDFADVLAVNGSAYACQTTAPGYTGGSLGRIWEFEGATATMLSMGMALPFESMTKTPDGTCYGLGLMNGRVVAMTTSADAGAQLTRVDLSRPDWAGLGSGAQVRPVVPGAGAPVIASWSLDGSPPLFSVEGEIPLGTRWCVQWESRLADATLPEVQVGFIIDPSLWPEGFDLENATLYRNDGSAWESVPSSFSASGPLLYSTDATGLSTWTATAPSSAPAEIRVTAVDLAVDGIRLEWDPNPGATGYTVEVRDTMAGGSWAPAAGVTWPIAETTWTDTDIAGRTRRFYRIESTAD